MKKLATIAISLTVLNLSASASEPSDGRSKDRIQQTADQSLSAVKGEAQGPRVPIGGKIPSLVFRTSDGKGKRSKISSESLLGKAIVLEYWGPFCTPCVAAFPHLNKLVEQFRDEPVVFISVADQSRRGCAKILRRHPLKTLQAFDTGKGDASIYAAFGVHALPRTVLIDRKGRVVAYTKPKHLTADVIRDVIKGNRVESHYKPSEFKR